MSDIAASSFQILEAQDIEIVSVATGRRATLEVAVREGWVICEHCGSPYDPADVELLREEDAEARCISDVCRNRRQPLGTVPLPIERIVVFARARMHRDFRHGLLYRIFYEHDDTHIHPHFALKEEAREAADATEKGGTSGQTQPTVREENWLNRGLVLTKRKRGRFVSWVPIGLPAAEPPPSSPEATDS